MRVFALFVLFFTTIFAKDIEATYRVNFGIFGEIGIAKTSLHVERNSYKITIYAKSTGFASLISGDRQEWYMSEGKIVDNRFVPDIYKKVVQREVQSGSSLLEDSSVIIKRYTLVYKFNHKNKTVVSTKIKTEGKKRSEYTQKLKFYAKNDLLSLFFNFKKIFPTLKIKKHHILYAVGANKDTGKIDIFPLSMGSFKKLMDGDMRGLNFMKVVLSDKIFASKKGELYLGLDKGGFCQKAVLKDVIFFGDIRGELIEKNY